MPGKVMSNYFCPGCGEQLRLGQGKWCTACLQEISQLQTSEIEEDQAIAFTMPVKFKQHLFEVHPEVQEYWSTWEIRKIRVEEARSSRIPICYYCEQVIPLEKRLKAGRKNMPYFCDPECTWAQRTELGFYYLFAVLGNEKMRQITEEQGERPGHKGRSEAMHRFHKKQRENGYANHWRNKRKAQATEERP